MDPQSAFYIKRSEDRIVLGAVERMGMTLTIKGPRQMGKSSLLLQAMSRARQLGKDVVYVDFQLFDSSALKDADTFFKQFCAWIGDELDLEDRIDEFWRRPLGNSQRCTRYLGKHILKNASNPIFLAMDEVERVFDTDFRSDFFSMLRSWHNDRAIDPMWKRLDLALVTSTEPYQLIENLNQSPFNVGEIVSLSDFTREQFAELNTLHGRPILDSEAGALHDLLGGHPYLSRKALYLLGSRLIDFGTLMASATSESSPFSDHLRHHLFRLHSQQVLVEGMKSILNGQPLHDDNIYWRLQGAGLVKRENGKIRARCLLYSRYFKERLDA